MPTRVPVWEFKRSTRRRNACLREPALMVGVILVIVTGLSLNGKAATNLPTLWTAGGLSAGSDSAGQAARVARVRGPGHHEFGFRGHPGP